MRFLAAHDGTPVWDSDVESGSAPDITALYRAAANGLPTPADRGRIGAGIGIPIPPPRPAEIHRRTPAA